MDDTLRYFFSALFQGFAALIALGAMYLFHHLNKIDRDKAEIIYKLNPYGQSVSKENRDYINLQGIVSYLEVKILPSKKDIPDYDIVRSFIEQHKTLQVEEAQLQKFLPSLSSNTIAILIISLICLFLVGYNQYLDNVLACVGVFSIILSIRILLTIKKVIKAVVEEGDVTML
ncbi:MAG: hypothetical protein KKA84_16285 [Bacteroidetes bacterium]|nr:hypothetical protein [Bacteroidota bacterium]